MINRISGSLPAPTVAPVKLKGVPTAPVPQQAPSSSPTLSTLSRQLADSALRADARDSTLDRPQLRVEADRLLSQIFGHHYQVNKELHNSEVPDTNDPELLERARQATLYIIRTDKRDHRLENPFAGLSREQLNLIAYDEKGPYTINERRAAYYGVSDMETRWNRTLWGPAELESAANDGRTPGFYTAVLNHYKTLPTIEQSRYPEDYEQRTLAIIKEESNPDSTQKKKFRILTLFEILAKIKHFKEKPGGLSGVTANPADQPKESPVKTSAVNVSASTTSATKDAS
ncbi:hypothetical protein [Pseudomonas sp. DWP3-1-2]|uniref:hypothetical protein n=1 Tax=Pseudomonas sp. DWP3-1-2 TaxID=2804645 RepID=UPI003CF004B4